MQDIWKLLITCLALVAVAACWFRWNVLTRVPKVERHKDDLVGFGTDILSFSSVRRLADSNNGLTSSESYLDSPHHLRSVPADRAQLAFGEGQSVACACDGLQDLVCLDLGGDWKEIRCTIKLDAKRESTNNVGIDAECLDVAAAIKWEKTKTAQSACTLHVQGGSDIKYAFKYVADKPSFKLSNALQRELPSSTWDPYALANFLALRGTHLIREVHYGQYGGAICTTSEQAEGVRRTLSARLGGGYAGIRAVAQAGHQSIEEISSQVADCEVWGNGGKSPAKCWMKLKPLWEDLDDESTVVILREAIQYYVEHGEYCNGFPARILPLLERSCKQGCGTKSCAVGQQTFKLSLPKGVLSISASPVVVPPINVKVAAQTPLQEDGGGHIVGVQLVAEQKGKDPAHPTWHLGLKVKYGVNFTRLLPLESSLPGSQWLPSVRTDPKLVSWGSKAAVCVDWAIPKNLEAHGMLTGLQLEEVLPQGSNSTLGLALKARHTPLYHPGLEQNSQRFRNPVGEPSAEPAASRVKLGEKPHFQGEHRIQVENSLIEIKGANSLDDVFLVNARLQVSPVKGEGPQLWLQVKVSSRGKFQGITTSYPKAEVKAWVRRYLV